MGPAVRKAPYRPDIDGLRAIAVGSVVLAHAQIPGFDGGFLGVDIFFVISGYLITGILLKDANLGRLSLLRFYERRIRRIVPALVVLLAASTLAATVLFSPYELRDYANSLLAATAFISNLFFMVGTDYWSPRYEVPLLHLWSLSVEEQFYLIYPFFLAWMSRRPRQLTCTLIALCIASFGLSELLAEVLPKNTFWEVFPDFEPGTAAFYFTGSRAWELLLGAVAARPSARATQVWHRLGTRGREALAAAGLLLVIVSIWLFNRHTAWPGLHALMPCSGTALLLALHANNRTLVSRVLSVRPLVHVGLISYSLYLWHWPLFEFFRRWVLRTPTPAEYAALIVLSCAAAWLSWQFVERPFRRSGGGIDRTMIFRAAAASALAMISVVAAIYAGGGFPGRFPPKVRNLYAILDGRTPWPRPDTVRDCHVHNYEAPYSFERCFRISPVHPNVVVWGDSFAGNYFHGFSEEGRSTGVTIIRASHANCLPVFDDRLVMRTCVAFNRAILAHLDRHIAGVVLATRIFYHQDLALALRETARTIARSGIPVIVMGPSLEYAHAGPFYIARYVETGDPRWLDSRSFLKPGLAEFDERLHSLFKGEHGVTYLSVLDLVCHGLRCPMVTEGVPVQRDFGHMTAPGSLLFAKTLWPVVRMAISSRPHGNCSRQSPDYSNAAGRTQACPIIP